MRSPNVRSQALGRWSIQQGNRGSEPPCRTSGDRSYRADPTGGTEPPDRAIQDGSRVPVGSGLEVVGEKAAAHGLHDRVRAVGGAQLLVDLGDVRLGGRLA